MQGWIIRAFKMHHHSQFYRRILEGYELGQTNPVKINVLDANNFVVTAWTTNVQAKTIANCFQHCKIRCVDEITSKNLDEF